MVVKFYDNDNDELMIKCDKSFPVRVGDTKNFNFDMITDYLSASIGCIDYLTITFHSNNNLPTLQY